MNSVFPAKIAVGLVLVAMVQWTVTICPCDMRKAGVGKSTEAKTCCKKQQLKQVPQDILSQTPGEGGHCGQYGKQLDLNFPSPDLAPLVYVQQLVAPDQLAIVRRQPSPATRFSGLPPPDIVVVTQQLLI